MGGENNSIFHGFELDTIVAGKDWPSQVKEGNGLIGGSGVPFVEQVLIAQQPPMVAVSAKVAGGEQASAIDAWQDRHE